MDPEEIIEAEWREVPRDAAGDIPEALRARARLAQSVALRDMANSWQRYGRLVSTPAPRVLSMGSSKPIAPLWLASCGGSPAERARAAETAAVNDFLNRPARPHPPLRSI